MHQKYGITVCDAFISLCARGGERGSRRQSIVSAIKVVKINNTRFNRSLSLLHGRVVAQHACVSGWMYVLPRSFSTYTFNPRVRCIVFEIKLIKI